MIPDPTTLTNPTPSPTFTKAMMDLERGTNAARLIWNLQQFTDTEHYYRHAFGRLLFTDGVRYLAEQAGAFWLIDAIASYQAGDGKRLIDLHCDGMQFWMLRVNHEDHTAVLTCSRDINRDGTPDTIAIQQDIEYTDFPLDRIVLYGELGGPNGELVLYLPSER